MARELDDDDEWEMFAAGGNMQPLMRQESEESSPASIPWYNVLFESSHGSAPSFEWNTRIREILVRNGITEEDLIAKASVAGSYDHPAFLTLVSRTYALGFEYGYLVQKLFPLIQCFSSDHSEESLQILVDCLYKLKPHVCSMICDLILYEMLDRETTCHIIHALIDILDSPSMERRLGVSYRTMTLEQMADLLRRHVLSPDQEFALQRAFDKEKMALKSFDSKAARLLSIPAFRETVKSVVEASATESMASSSPLVEYEIVSSCVICTAPIEGRTVILQCGHMYHPQCIDDWLNQKAQRQLGVMGNRCPLCKRMPYREFTGMKKDLDDAITRIKQ